MTKEQREMINGFFVTAFNRILAWEDQSLRSIGKKDISVREMHIIEAVSILEGKKMNTMANIAKVLSVSPGSLTTAVNALVAKEYLIRWRSESDRRVVLVSPTEKGVEVNKGDLDVTSRAKITYYLDNEDYISKITLEKAVNEIKEPKTITIKYKIDYDGETSYISRKVTLKARKTDATQ